MTIKKFCTMFEFEEMYMQEIISIKSCKVIFILLTNFLRCVIFNGFISDISQLSSFNGHEFSLTNIF